MKPTDEIVAKLLKKVEDKEKAIPAKATGSWKTKCSYDIGDGRINIQTCGDIHKLAELHGIITMAREGLRGAFAALGVSDICKIVVQGYAPDDWHADISRRVNNLSIDVRTKELKELKKQVDNLKSEELKTNMELDRLSKLLDI